MRPKEVVSFERLMLASVALAIVNIAILWTDAVSAGRTLAPIFIAIVLGVMGVIVGLTLLVSRRRSRIALWIIVVLFVLGVPNTLKTIFTTFPHLDGIVMAVQAICQAIAVALLFAPATRRWLKRQPDPRAEAEIFS